MELSANCEYKELQCLVDIPMIETVIITVTLAKMNLQMLLK